jgi:hypothetical protein
MWGYESCAFSLWWIFPLLMMLLCFFMMRGRWGSKMCGFCCGGRSRTATDVTESATDTRNKRRADEDMDGTNTKKKHG